MPAPACFVCGVLPRVGQLPAAWFVGCCFTFEKLVKVKPLSAPGQRATLMKGLFIILMGYSNLLTSLSAMALAGQSPKKKKAHTHSRTPTATMHIHTSAQVRKIYSKNRTVALWGSIKEEWWLWAAFGFRVAGPLGSGTESKCPTVH